MTISLGSKRSCASLVLTVSLAVAACGGTDDDTGGANETAEQGEAAPDRELMTREEICELGAEEGGFTHWHNHNPENMDQIYAAFNEAYPAIRPQQQNMTPDEAAQRILTEGMAGQGLSVDLAAGGAEVFAAVTAEGMADTELDWTGYGIAEDLVHDANMIRIHRIVMGLGYNTDMLTADDLPDTWEGLIDDQWRGRVIVDPRGRPFDLISLMWGNDQAIDYVERLSEVVQPLVIEGGTAGLLSVASGEADITTGGRSDSVLEQRAEGLPLEIKYLDVVSTEDQYNLVLADAENLNAARCYAIWFSSEGQGLYEELEFKANETVPTAAPEGAQIVTVDSEADATAALNIGREMGRIWTGQ